jgi:hypothetical protein
MWNPFRKVRKQTSPAAVRLNEILNAYAEILANESAPFIMDESRLPATKKEVKLALLAVLASSVSEEERERWRCSYLYLASFLPGVGPEGIRDFDAQDHDRLRSQLGWAEKFAEESDRLKAELNQIESKLGTDEFISVLQWLRDLKPRAWGETHRHKDPETD